MTAERLDADFIDSAGGRIFVLLHRPAEPVDGCVLFVPPFAEEMNKCRRQATETAKAIVGRRFAALLVDLYGTGDSEGEFSDATWSQWKLNVVAAMTWAARQGLRVNAVVAARLGCILAADSLRDAGMAVGTSVFWQPVTVGRQFLTQFLRLRVAASMMESDRPETVEKLKARLGAGETLEVAGYPLSPLLAQRIEEAELTASLHAGLGRLRLIEIGRAGGSNELTAAGKRLLRGAEQKSIESHGLRVPGEPFWASTETVVNSTLAALTAEYLESAA